jgi:hypothetical protein
MYPGDPTRFGIGDPFFFLPLTSGCLLPKPLGSDLVSAESTRHALHSLSPKPDDPGLNPSWGHFLPVEGSHSCAGRWSAIMVDEVITPQSLGSRKN